jgi:hypothetical protein
MSLFMCLLVNKLIWKEDNILKGMSPVSLNQAFSKMKQLKEKGVKQEDIGIYRINKK